MKQSFRRLFLAPLLAAGILLSGASPAFAASAASVLTLTATPNPSGNFVALNWTNSDKSQPYSYMLYSKSAHESTFQSIPAKDNAKVLNIYPVVAPTVSFTTWKGKSYTLPKSASLKMWMETPNEYDSKGYGKGLISVDAVSISDFNANPDAYLKNADGSYKYDVLYFGAWDAFASQDLSAVAETKTDAFIKTGRGVLFGHDTMVDNDTISMPNFFKLAHYCDIQTIPHYTVLGSSQIKISKKGLLTNYPWKIGDVGTVLNVPMSHSNQLAFGDVWMTYQQPYTYSGSAEATGQNGQGTNTFYLTSWSNCAMIQTGHSNGEATPDEQRVTANTLFYLAQITTDTSWNDHKGQDLDAPDEPVISGVTHNPGRTQYTVNYSSQDNATGYQYYVEATGQNDGAKYDSPVISTSLKTGMKGYSIVVDDKPDTVPDGSITTTSDSFTFSRPSGSSFYIHIAAVDNAGNISTVAHYHTDELVSVTHPVSIGYSIDPNSDTPFTAPDIPITNHSTFPVRVSVAELKATSGIGDAAPTAYSDWNSLTAAQTGSEMALGVGISKISGSGWTAVDRATPVYTDDLASEVPLGTLGANGASGNLALTAKFGLAWAKATNVSHELTLNFTISD
ncbi:DUF5057 domain-containing protein [Ethanoligenens harbinense]|uniref:TPR repeat-containing cell adhesion protein n=1 Tax=Ethanoligenens harbinense (strain DSM 18485 / JCM 12961 / CGMCC 1.5033 / YUAN-3) TaxID=663278 RepID=E6UA43_ETHHY|nr:DUF5057 domain-containing protein [Ethanoligenens harbinense]ADU27404.1 TPR repeat-containing cell adhesion protein [Ethanoligenens harbinense YUAN-3]AVQ96463.1 DUF5057 domain-containing protein [Ethanoligenens harbinense YUAN-3]AYF39122.1 DUF5057 domain-containing protein [Ethanoligenens harbinense]AYF41948.1 DUF5057 domain-containing protein [Ethanoligenens harbinense]QCN92704.1 DUF5057 domain-containing protein [Ethanoligenens harbinense]